MTKKINLITAIKRVKESIEEKGEDYIYESPDGDGTCKYFYNGQPSCLVGHVFDKEGFDYQEIEYLEDISVHGIFLGSGVRIFTERAAEFLDCVQELQDCGTPWGEAFERGLELVGKNGIIIST